MVDLKGLVEAVAKALADEPNAVRVSESDRRGTTVIELQVAPGDLGRVIGRQGRTAAAVRTLLSAAAEGEGKKATLDIRMPQAADWEDMILVGFVARSHGNKGQVILKSETDFPEARFRVGASLYARKDEGPIETLEVTSVRFQQGRPIIGLSGFTSIDEAGRLTGAELKVPESDQDPLPAGTYYHHQLIGCEVVTPGGDAIGRVTEVQGDGEATRLVVRGPRAEVLIPLTHEFCDIDVAAKKIVATLPAGLLEVNGEWR